MSLDKSINHGKEKRRPYKKAKAIDPSCRNHGGCAHCENGRKHSDRKREPIVEEEIES